MNWAAISAIGELLGAVAVIVSLIYLSGQVRHSSQVAKSTSLQTLLQSEMAFANMLLQNAEVWEKVLRGEPLADGKELREGVILYNLFMLESANRFAQYKNGYLDARDWANREQVLAKIVAWPIYTNWIESLGAKSNSTEFLALVKGKRSDFEKEQQRGAS